MTKDKATGLKSTKTVNSQVSSQTTKRMVKEFEHSMTQMGLESLQEYGLMTKNMANFNSTFRIRQYRRGITPTTMRSIQV